MSPIPSSAVTPNRYRIGSVLFGLLIAVQVRRPDEQGRFGIFERWQVSWSAGSGIETDNPSATIRMQTTHGPHHGATPVVTAKHCLLDALGIQQANEVITEILHVVLRWILGPAGEAKSALVRCQTVISGCTDRSHLVAPAIG